MKIRKNSIILTILTLFFLCLPFQASAVVHWTKSGSNPVLSPAASGSWDDYAVALPKVIKDGSTYKMWYTGLDDVDSSATIQVGYATSSDGIAWTRGNGGNPVLSHGVSGEWDSRLVVSGGVIKEGSTYKMWYDGSDVLDSNDNIGYATSTDGINWTKYDDAGTPNAPYADSDPVLTKGTAGVDWDGEGVYDPTVLIDNDAPASQKYKMWYVGYDGTLGTEGIGYAYSSDGINWTKYGGPVSGISRGAQGSWNEGWRTSPTVIKEDSVYRMWLRGDSINDGDAIGYYYSVDGINWTQYKGNPVVMKGDTGMDDFDENGADDPMVIKDGTTYKMWYSGDKDCDPCLTQIGYATAPAYPGTDLNIDKIQARINNSSGGVRTAVSFITEGPGFLDFNELKVDGPSGFSHTFTDSDIWNEPGGIIHFFSTTLMPGAGTYTFTAKSNNGLIATESLDFSSPTILPVPGTGSGAGELDMQIKVGTATYHNVDYIGTTTPSFRFKPAGGTDKHYRVKVFDFRTQWTVWYSALTPGTATDVNGYIEVPVPANVLLADTPYQWRIDIYDTDDPWTGHSRASCDKWVFYTGTKDNSTNPNFISDTGFRSYRSFLSGNMTSFGLYMINLAPWDIDVSDGSFSVLNEGGTGTFYNFNPNNNAQTTPYKFYYWAGIGGIPPDATTPGYEFVVTENTNFYFESVNRLYQDVPTLPMVTRKDMLLEDNAYLTNTTPTLSWISKGAGYKYRVFITNWAGQTIYFNMKNGLPAGQTMSETIPHGTLWEYKPYTWCVEVFDINEYSVNRGNMLTFMTGGEENILNDELAVDFGANGLWHYDGTTWSKKTSWDPDDDLTGWIGWTYGLAVDFGANGLWNYDGMAWSKKTGWNAGSGGMTGWTGGLAVDFDGNGLWNYDGSTWSKKTGWDTGSGGMAGWTGGLAVDFDGNGLWNYDGSTWSKKTSWNPGSGGLASWSGGLAVDFDGNGLWNYDGSTWTKKTSWDVGSGGMAGWSGGLAVDFDGNGLWNYDGSTWSKKTSLNPEGISALGSGFAADFGASGLWYYDGTTWIKKTSWDAENLTDVDLY